MNIIRNQLTKQTYGNRLNLLTRNYTQQSRYTKIKFEIGAILAGIGLYVCHCGQEELRKQEAIEYEKRQEDIKKQIKALDNNDSLSPEDKQMLAKYYDMNPREQWEYMDSMADHCPGKLKKLGLSGSYNAVINNHFDNL